VDEAIAGALEVLKVPKESVEVRIIEKGESGILGVFGGRDAEVEVKLKLDIAQEAKQVLQEILDKMGFMAQVYMTDATDSGIFLDIKGDDISRIIGKDGYTIDAIQYLINIIVNKGEENRKRIDIDAGGYRKKQEKRVEHIATETAEEVILSKKEIMLPPMNPRERRIVHMTIKNMKNVSSHSTGEKGERRVIITPEA
jgi:spoIIIJ-associated protein